MTIPVVIIGGGLAGLYAGQLLKVANIEFKILEANNRPGGRILSKPHSKDNNYQFDVDLGPTWFWPHQTELLDLLKSLKVEKFLQYNQGQALFEAERHSPVEKFMPSYMESYKIVGGMHRLISGLAAELPKNSIELNFAVSRIESMNHKWHVSCVSSEKPEYVADRIIIAAPPRIVVEKLVVADEKLKSLITVLKKTPTWMAAQAKFVATYKNPFWRDRGLSGQVFSRLGPMVEIHDASSADNEGFALFGFIGVPASDRIIIPQEELQGACLQQLGRVFGEQALDSEKTYLVDWAKNEFIANDADINEHPEHPFVDLTPYRQSLIDNGLYFGGSEVATKDPGYLQGAIVAASDAVRGVIQLSN